MDSGLTPLRGTTEVVSHAVTSCRFSFYESADLRAVSCVRVGCADLLDRLNEPVPGGLYDPKMGPITPAHQCVTCSLSFKDCPGHLGHIDLPVRAYTPALFPTASELLRGQCARCHRLRIPRAQADAAVAVHSLLDAGLVVDAANVAATIDFKGAAGDLVPGGGVSATGTGLGDASPAAPVGLGTLTLAPGLHLSREAMAELEQFGNLGGTGGGGRPRQAAAATTHGVELRAKVRKRIMANIHPDKCPECAWHSPKLKAEGTGKLFQMALSAKFAKSNADQLAAERAARAEMGNEDEDDGDSPVDGAVDGIGGLGTAVGLTVVGSGAGGNRARAFVAANDAHRRLCALWIAEAPLLAALHPGLTPDVLTMDAVPVPPSRFRQPMKLNDELVEHPKNVYLGRILQAAVAVRELLARIKQGKGGDGASGRADGRDTGEGTEEGHARRTNGPAAPGTAITATGAIVVAPRVVERRAGDRGGTEPAMAQLLTRWQSLQVALNCVYDSSLSGLSGPAALQEPPGVKQTLERKEGLFRMHMMGKRVNFAARSVISPDPYIGTGDIGVPLHFATTLTIPEPVTPWNEAKLRQAVINGPATHPGANYVQTESGEFVDLRRRSRRQREALAKTLSTVDVRTNAHLGGAPGGSLGSVAAIAAAGAGPSRSDGDLGDAPRAALLGLQPKRVLRHIETGDVLLVNRQPTLHKPGMMAHTAVVLPSERVIRMHYANCSTYNADFDGDEINLHCPQGQPARAEAYGIAATAHQYTVPTSGRPIRGLIQDHVVAGVQLTRRDRFLSFGEFCQLLHLANPHAAPGSLQPVPQPAVLRPVPLWTGKQLVSAVIKSVSPLCGSLHLDSKAKVGGDAWGWAHVRRDESTGEPVGGAPSKDSCEEGAVIVRGGELLVGLLDKAAFGASEFGVVHAVHELAGDEAAARLLSALGRLLTSTLQVHAFTCCVSNFLLRPEAERKRRDELATADARGDTALRDLLEAEAAETAGEAGRVGAATDTVNVGASGHRAASSARDVSGSRAALQAALRERFAAAHLRGEDLGAKVDAALKATMAPITSSVQSACLPSGQRTPFPRNAFALMVTSGAKGSLVNFLQIACLLGQQELEGRRVPRTAVGRTAPCFPPFDLSARAGGYIADRFLTGVSPSAFYFHCMSGREGLVDTAVKTSRSGYLQRCLVKHLEALSVAYDHTVRAADGGVVQFVYGEDGCEATQTKWLGPGQLSFYNNNGEALEVAWGLRRPAAAKAPPVAPDAASRLDANAAHTVLRAWRRAGAAGKARGKEVASEGFPRSATAALAAGDTLLAAHLPRVHLGVVSESFAERMHAACQKATMAGGARALEALLCTKYMRALAAPGEAVGLLAAQSVGEPSTQMTLNTFHLAGVGGANVTLGIPRMREILMVASRAPATPLMQLPVRENIAANDGDGGLRRARRLGASLRRVTLGQLAASFATTVCLRPGAAVGAAGGGGGLVDDDGGVGSGGARPDSGADGGYVRHCAVAIQLLPLGAHTPRATVEGRFRDAFIPTLDAMVDKVLRKQGEASKEVRELIGGFATPSAQAAASRAAADADAAAGVEPSRVEAAAAAGDGVEGVTGAVGTAADRVPSTGTRRRDTAAQADVLGDEGDEDLNGDDDDFDPDDAREGLRRARRGNTVSYDGPTEDDAEAIAGDGNGADAGASLGLGADTKGTAAEADGTAAPGDIASGTAKYVRAFGTRPGRAGGGGELWLEVHLPPRASVLLTAVLQDAAEATEVLSTPHISAAFAVPPGAQGRAAVVQTAGVNFAILSALDGEIDPARVGCNDVWAMLNTYGVEAARATLVKEVQTVFGAYGIAVDTRHLSLIADYMTYEGGYKPLNRNGMASSTSPLLKMSFETTIGFLTAAAIADERDCLASPAANIVVGRPIKHGTGSFDLLQPLALPQPHGRRR